MAARKIKSATSAANARRRRPSTKTRSARSSAPPLAGVRVLELGAIVAGPLCGRLLADFGADVVKVEPLEGDGLRSVGRRLKGKSLHAASLHRNKRTAAIDLRRPEGQDLVRRLARKCDVLIENFRPGTLERWGLGYDSLARDNPGLVMVRISGFGQTGRYSHLPGMGVVCEAMSGLRHVTGEPDRPPSRVGMHLTDYITGLYAAYGVMLALHARARTGRGQVIDTALTEAALSFMEAHVPAYDKLEINAERTGSRLVGSAPNNLYPCADGAFVQITGNHESLFRRFAAAMGRPELPEEPRFANLVERSRNADAIDAIVSEWTRAHPAVEVERMLREAAVPVARVYTMADVFADPYFRERGMLQALADDDLGSVTVVGPVPRLGATPAKLRHAGRRTGQDTRALLKSELRLSDKRIAALEAAGIVGCDPQAKGARGA